MMLRERLQRFLVVSLLVTVTSEQSRNCSICGDGYEVGSPYASASLSCPDAGQGQGSSDTLCTCKDLEIAGFQGLISDCSNVSLVIFEACHCRENTSQNTWFPTYSPSVAPVAPTYYPVASPLLIRPATFPPTPDPAGGPVFAILFSMIFCMFFFAPCIGACLVYCLKNGGAGVCRRCCVYFVPSRYNEGTQPNFSTHPASTPTGSIGNAQSRRPLVLAALFPKEGRLEGDGHTGERRNLRYDPQSRHYVFCENVPDAVTCSICMEFLVPTDDTVTSLCSHTYHRECIMSWLQCGHDECPNCRQAMWDPKTYEIVDECIKNGDSSSPFAV